MAGVLILGTGLAGYHLARQLRRAPGPPAFELVTADAGHFYSKPMLSNALAQGKEPRDLVAVRREAMEAELGVPVHAHTRVTAIDLEGRRVLAGERVFGFERLVLAVGARPRPLDLAGAGAGQVMAVNHLDDYARFRARLAQVRDVAIVGPGLIGCEFANDLAQAGYRVTVVGPGPEPLGRLLPPELGRLLREALAELGVAWRLGRQARALERAGAGLALVLDDGSTVACGLVLSAVGLAPDTALARAAGLSCGRGIQVDRHLAASAPGVYALGDCAEVAGWVLPFVMPIMQAAPALARTLAGTPTPVTYPAMPVVVKTPALPLAVCPPPPGQSGTWQVEGGGRDRVARFLDESGRLWGFALSGAATRERMALAKTLPPWLG